MRQRRALLYIPGADERKIRKAPTLDADCICLDMEDGVAASRKVEARTTVAAALRELDFGRAERLARINPPASGLAEEDLAAALAGRPDGVVIPKVEHAADIAWADARIAAAEQAHGWPAGGVALIAMVETALGIVNLAQIAGASPRLQALIFGAEDFAGDIGAIRTPAAWEVFYARSAVVTHAAACGLQAIDMVYIDYRDTAGLTAEAEAGARLGYTGKQVIHPAQIAAVQAAFTPDAAAIAHARRLLAAMAEHQAAGAGAFSLDGKMIDMPLIKAARRVLARAGLSAED
ncbi:MAG: Citrate lyase subunit beta [Chloroflexi bacterium ADurb.Bin325]|nr:MAG: Citrate lyase subunit beta [Chloroflexi bacterium ADurb.Bin325]